MDLFIIASSSLDRIRLHADFAAQFARESRHFDDHDIAARRHPRASGPTPWASGPPASGPPSRASGPCPSATRTTRTARSTGSTRGTRGRRYLGCRRIAAQIPRGVIHAPGFAGPDKVLTLLP